jgi:hypothetical protein
MQGLKYTVDIVMCIDSTGSMAPIMDTVKDKALKFYPDLSAALASKDKNVDVLRMKVVAFRDFYDKPGNALLESPFFTLPEQQGEFQRFVRELEPTDGGDEPENGLEALAVAIKSDWNTTGDRRREIIVMYTDASAHALDCGMSKPANYPAGIPKNFNELTDWWSGQDNYVSQTAQRLIIYAPDCNPWSDISNEWENSIHYASQAGSGLKEIDYETILSAIVKSV